MTPLLRRPAVLQLIGYSVSGLYAEMRKGRFPHPLHVGPRAVAWREDEVHAWIEARTAERDANLPKKRGRPRKNPFLAPTT